MPSCPHLSEQQQRGRPHGLRCSLPCTCTCTILHMSMHMLSCACACADVHVHVHVHVCACACACSSSSSSSTGASSAASAASAASLEGGHDTTHSFNTNARPRPLACSFQRWLQCAVLILPLNVRVVSSPKAPQRPDVVASSTVTLFVPCRSPRSHSLS